jgi:hypothetical protein
MLWHYKSDNTNHPDPKNFIEYLRLVWHNLWDKEYQNSKRLYERLHRNDNKMSKSERAKLYKSMRQQAKNQQRGDRK